MRITSTIYATALFATVCLLSATVCNAQNFHLTKDINSFTDGDPSNNYPSYSFDNLQYANLNGIIYFTANEGTGGHGFWRSDGTTFGTYELKDVLAGNITTSNGKIFFSTYDTLGLWVSDGTVEGTKKVLTSLPSGLTRFTPSSLTDVNGVLYFVISGNDFENQLWKTDGTTAGTVLVKDLYNAVNPSLGSNGIRQIKAAGDKLCFTAISLQNYFIYLWISNGTPEGTYQITTDVKNVFQFAAAKSAFGQTLVYFSGNDGFSNNPYLWVTNGQKGNVSKVSNPNNIILNQFNRFISVKDVIYFSGYANPNMQTENLYKYDVNNAFSIAPVKILPAGTDDRGTYSRVSSLNSDTSGNIYFTVYDAPGKNYQLWKYNDSAGSNTLLKDGVNASLITAFGRGIYFNGSDSTHGAELWKSDGTPAGTILVDDMNHGKSASHPQFITNGQDDQIFFAANDGTFGNELWLTHDSQNNGKLDGGLSGTTLVKDFNTTITSSTNPNSITAYKNGVIFSALKDKYGLPTLWKSDGTATGTAAVSSKLTLTNGSSRSFLVHKKEVFLAGNYNGVYGVIKTDGTEKGTSLVKALPSYEVLNFVKANNLFYFETNDPASGSYLNQLWRSDGTEAGTYIIKSDVGSGYLAMNYAPFGNGLIFINPDDNSLWKTDGTVAGTVKIKAFSSLGTFAFVYNGNVYFEAGDGTTNGLWASDGTEANTKLVSNGMYNITKHAVSNNKLYFSGIANPAVYGDLGEELFVTDGTAEGTRLVKDIYPGNNASYPSNMTDLNGTLYFFASDAAYQAALWRTDGTEEGTHLVKPIPNNVNSSIYNRINLVNATGTLYFVSADGLLWQSDGSADGTHPVEDNNLQGVYIYNNAGGNSTTTPSGDQLFFGGVTELYGYELFAGKTATVLPVTLLSFGAKLVDKNGVVQWSTASEHNSSYFILQRSINGRDFVQAAKVSAAGNTNTVTKYSYTDLDIARFGVSNVYYRLLQADKDGKTTASNIVVLHPGSNLFEVIATPNPIVNELNVVINASLGQPVKIVVTNAAGSVMVSDVSRNLSSGSNILSYQATTWSSGVYFIKVTLINGTSKTISVLKQ